MQRARVKVRKALVCLQAALFFALTVLCPLESFADDARIDDVHVRAEPYLKISFVVRDAFKQDIEEAIKSGITTSFTFFVELTRLRTVWLNETVKVWEFRHIVKYDSLKEEYEVTLEETHGPPIRTKDFEEVKRLMVTATDIAFVPPPVLERGSRYVLRVMAELDTIDLPFLLNYMFFFVKFWDFETDWHTTTFSY
jgi:hypothetical protein